MSVNLSQIDNSVNIIRALLLGDIVGQPGCRAIFSLAQKLKKEYKADFLLVNAENGYEGSGLTQTIVNELFRVGVDVITSGNHIWRNKEILPLLDSEPRLLRPENYPRGVPGKGIYQFVIKDCPIIIINLEGNLNSFSRLRCPFATAKEILSKVKQFKGISIIDFHAEHACEKEALAAYLDGEVSLVFGTHTHVPTADERFFPGKTAYITDIGMCGPKESVIGMSVKIAVERALTQMPLKLEVENKPAIISGIYTEFDKVNGRCVKLKRISHESIV